ncbi:hypothetical protein GN958_ATG22285 [Phytophthora infestans]|uniref:Uncharacterized protein n=1 Tax=Phytophthora infestans TaxID=4787 RepID=A0A8S9TI24_PHYIN|nr:hypothetical protein GN958_ATG22285 [Phytophthora infestans]
MKTRSPMRHKFDDMPEDLFKHRTLVILELKVLPSLSSGRLILALQNWVAQRKTEQHKMLYEVQTAKSTTKEQS